MSAMLHQSHRFKTTERNQRIQPVEQLFVMTVDVDSWSSLLRFYSVNHDPSMADFEVNVEDGILRLQQLFERHGIKATFFVPGEVARKHARAIKEISRDNHEVACHGLTHQKNECLLDKASQRQTIEEATRTIEQVHGARPKGFRAPCLRSNETTLRVLEECGYLYDSSVIPTLVPGYYGSLNAPMKPYDISTVFTKNGDPSKFKEIPVSVNPIFPLPLSAAWMRNLGSTWVKFGVRTNFAFGNPVVFYVHPRDVVLLPKIRGVPWHLYRNVGDPTLRMLDEVIRYAKTLGATFIKALDLACLS